MSSDKVGAVLDIVRTKIEMQKRYLESRLGKIGSLGPRHKVIGHCRSVRMLPVIPNTQRNNW